VYLFVYICSWEDDMELDYIGFEWDDGNWPKCGQHGLTKEEIESVFQSEPLIVPDPSPKEMRIRAIAKLKNRYLFLVFTIRSIGGKNFIRPISARYMHNREVENYGKRT